MNTVCLLSFGIYGMNGMPFKREWMHRVEKRWDQHNTKACIYSCANKSKSDKLAEGFPFYGIEYEMFKFTDYCKMPFLLGEKQTIQKFRSWMICLLKQFQNINTLVSA